MSTFKQGWFDRLDARSYPPGYEKFKLKNMVDYERGRHAASVWLACFAELTIERVGLPRVPYTEARHYMPRAAKKILAEEAKFCRQKVKALSVKI